MGRVIKRVSLDFDWPQGKVWDGFLNPHYRACPECKAGWSTPYELLRQHIAPMMWSRELVADPVCRLVLEALAGRGAGVFGGHDSIDASNAVQKIAELADLPEKWDTCAHCGGDAIDPAVKEAYEAWTATEPPTGDGWQVWETVSEGSPVSPAFPTRDALRDWLVSQGHTREAAERFIDAEWAPSGMITGGQYLTGVDAMGVL